MHPRNDRKNRRRAVQLSAGALLLALAPLGRAQSAPTETIPAPAKPQAEGETVVLSPFEVTDESGNGYAATSTLAGSRLKTELKDIASPISVVTQQFFKDTGATNAESLMVYTTSTEVGGIQGNYGGDPTLAKLQPSKNNRVRGLDGADQTREYFATDIPLDTYNVTQVDIQRGPNSILFGLGSPAGIFNYSLKTPTLQKNRYNLELRYGSFGSARQTFDADQTILKDTLGVRVTGVNNNNQFQQKHTFENQKRIYGSVRWSPKVADGVFTQLTASIERGNGSYNRPETRPPEDWISTWFTRLNKMTNATGTWPGYTFSNVPQYAPYLAAYQAGPGGNWWDGLGLVFSKAGDPNSGGPGIPNAIRQRGGDGAGSGSWITPSNPFQVGDGTFAGNHFFSNKNYYAGNATVLKIISDYEAATGKTFSDGRDLGWQAAQVLDRSVFDYRNYSLAGPSNRSWDDIDAKNVSLVQTFMNNRFGYEASYDNQSYENGNRDFLGGGSGNRLAVDINEKLRDGTTANPNFGRAVVVGDYGSNFTQNDRETLRATAFYNLKIRDLVGHRNFWTDLFGEHTFTGLAARQRHTYLNYSQSLYALGNEYVNGYREDRGIQSVNYLDSAFDLKSAAGLAGAHINGIGSVHRAPSRIAFSAYNRAGYWDVGNSSLLAYDDGTNGPKLIGTSPTATKDSTVSRALIWQSRLLWDNVVGLVAMRNDNYTKETKGAPKVINGGPGLSYADLNSPDWNYANAESLKSRITANKTQPSYGLVVRVPEFIRSHLPYNTDVSVSFNKANNFNPGALGFDPYRNANPSPAGETKDYGVRINTLDGKLELRFTSFKTSQKNTPVGNLPAWSIKNRLSRAMNGLFVEGWNNGTSGRRPTTPEWIVNKWMFGDNYDKSVAAAPLPAGWTVADHPELLTQPLRIRRAALTVKQGDIDANNNVITEPDVAADEIAYRTAWFKAQPDSAWYRPFGKELFDALQFRRDYNYWGGMWVDNVPSDMKGVGDIVTKGQEYEITFNPTKNWRITGNLSKASATTSGVWAAIGDYITKFEPVALDGWDKNVSSGTSLDYWTRNGFADVDAWGNNGGQMLGWDWYNDVKKSFLTMKAGEGKEVAELRKWHANIVTSYDFTEGRLKGVTVGGAVRWMSSATLGYYNKYDKALGTWISDLEMPIKAPSEVSYDAWIGYERRLSKRINWSIQLNLRNLFAHKDLIPVAANGDGTYGTYRIGPSTTWDLTNRFEF
ncbi:TonB-dependent receptor plug domain-containing protein [Nibricoccus sp. IMCC34717]|uniref:TonB-dependent receptor plug domain-containing protein n=1 Tax=Nibricoccus sp. IMCC34717 TaxID=3034021 RepID=UPI00384E0813